MRRAYHLYWLTLLLPLQARADKTGPVELELDATDAPRKILHARLTIPANPGPLTLYYPKWIPGEHAPTGPIADVAGLRLRAAGKTIPWRRDDLDLHTFRCDVPAGAAAVEVSLDYLMPGAGSGFSSSGSATPRLAVIDWHLALLYPKGPSQGELQVRAALKLPDGWQFGTALPVETQQGPRVRFAPVSLETLIDSPVLCGRHLREIPIGPRDAPPHFLVVACDSPSGLEVGDAQKAKYDRLVAEAGALFGARHHKSYRFLLTLSDQVAHFGLEHHESSDNRAPERLFLDEELRDNTWFAYLLPHEYVHSWNGKYRRPAEMVVRDLQQPQRTRLLWVYEGLTEYLGVVLAARSGLWTPERRASTSPPSPTSSRTSAAAPGAPWKTPPSPPRCCTARGATAGRGAAAPTFTTKALCFGWKWTP